MNKVFDGIESELSNEDNIYLSSRKNDEAINIKLKIEEIENRGFLRILRECLLSGDMGRIKEIEDEIACLRSKLKQLEE